MICVVSEALRGGSTARLLKRRKQGHLESQKSVALPPCLSLLAKQLKLFPACRIRAPVEIGRIKVSFAETGLLRMVDYTRRPESKKTEGTRPAPSLHVI